VGDCIPFMGDKCKKEGRMFDYIFGDLTDIPISLKAEGEVWDFFKTTLQLSFSILKPEGSYFTHANGVTSGDNLKMFEDTIRGSLDFHLDFKTSSAFIPSFMEKWVFYQVKRA
jgi:spermine synthase